jgi:hypothetical protein
LDSSTINEKIENPPLPPFRRWMELNILFSLSEYFS